MDRLTAFVAINHLKLRLQYLDRHPELIEKIVMETKRPLDIRRPIELAGMKSRLLRAQQQEKDIAATGKKFDLVMDGIDEAHGAVASHVGALGGVESDLRATIERMIAGSNGDPTDGGLDGRQSLGDSSASPEEPDPINRRGHPV